MPDNNRKALDDMTLYKLKAMYTIEYDEPSNSIVVGLTTCKRKTSHPADKQFCINCKKLKKKIVFSLLAIEFFKEFSKDKKMNKYTLFDVNNAINKLKIMYQKPDRDNVSNLLRNDFRGIKKLGEY